MVIRAVTEKTDWEGLITTANQDTDVAVSFFQSWNWGEFEAAQGINVFRWSVVDELSGKLIALMQAFLITAKRGRYLHVRNGPVFADRTQEAVKVVANLLKAEAKKLNCAFVRISPLIPNNPVEAQKFRSIGFALSQMHDVDAEVTWLLDLQQPAEEILKAMRDSHRYLVRKALKNTELEIEKTSDPFRVAEFWPIYKETFERQKWKAYNIKYLEKEFAAYAKDNQVMLFLAKYQGKYIAGSMFIYYQDQVYYHHSGSLTEYRNIPAMYLIHWESILEAQARGMKTYNFFGIARSADPHHPWAGLTLFKKGFGGQQQEWLHAMDLPIKPGYWFTHYYELFERKKRGY